MSTKIFDTPVYTDVIFSSIGCADSGFMDYAGDCDALFVMTLQAADVVMTRVAEWLRYVAATPMPMVNDFLMFYRPSTIEGGYPGDLQANQGVCP